MVHLMPNDISLWFMVIAIYIHCYIGRRCGQKWLNCCRKLYAFEKKKQKHTNKQQQKHPTTNKTNNIYRALRCSSSMFWLYPLLAKVFTGEFLCISFFLLKGKNSISSFPLFFAIFYLYQNKYPLLLV